jgi:predicted nucleic acid-binding protein
VIHLDTSFLIGALVMGSPQDQRLRGWLAQAISVAISSISWAEFLCGPVDEETIELAKEIVAPAEPFLVEDAAVAARFFDLGGRRRGSFADCMIAAIAVRVGAELATANHSDFKRFEPGGLKLASAP